MKVLAFALIVALTTALPVDQDDHAGNADPLPDLFLNLMKDVISPATKGQAGAGGDPVIKDVMSLIGTIAKGNGGGGNSGGAGKGLMDDPMVKMVSNLAQTLMASQAGGDKDSSDDGVDPMVKMGMAGMKAFMQTMEGDQQGLEEDASHHKAAAKDDPLAPIMNLLMKGMTALAKDKNGDPVGAVMNVVLEDPVMSANPVIRAVKAAINDKTGDPLNAMIDSLMQDKEMRKDPYIVPILRIAKNIVNNMPKDGDGGDPVAAILNALAGPPPASRKNLISPDAAH